MAEEAIVLLLVHTHSLFGARRPVRCEAFASHRLTGLRNIGADPERFGSIARRELGQDVRSYHLERNLPSHYGNEALGIGPSPG
jgi:toxin ParE1/3/4